MGDDRDMKYLVPACAPSPPARILVGEDQVPGQSTRPVIGRWQVDLAMHQVTRADAAKPLHPAQMLRLTPIQWGILELLLRRPGYLVSSAQILASVWGPGFQQHTNYLRFHMARLRRKLEDNPASPRHLVTEPGMGYRYLP
jgi:two-component system, OmpR family, KDP operon response regulator KdpE